jgi:hypothetical protein
MRFYLSVENFSSGLIMQSIYNLLGRLCFPRQQGWLQQRNAKIMVLTVGFALALGVTVAAVIRMMYYHKKG